MNKETLRMQMLAGIITEGQYKNQLTESSKLTKMLRKLGWFGDTWTPQEYKTQIRNLSDDTLLLWYNSKETPIPNSPLDFQNKLVKLEIERRGLDK